MPNNAIIFLVQESPEGSFEARALDYSIFTQTDSLEKLEAEIADALACHFDESRSAVLRFHE